MSTHVVVSATAFLIREPRRVDKSKWCTVCGGPGIHGKQQRYGRHGQCTGFRRTIDRKTVPCECPCKLDQLDPNL